VVNHKIGYKMKKKLKVNSGIKRRKGKGRKDWVSTSIAFKKANLDYLKEHDLYTQGDVSVSWIVNKLVEKFKTGDIALEID
jgi:hypothetical protein